MPYLVDPRSIPSFVVIRIDWDFGYGSVSKIFVTIGHYPKDHIYCLKATSQLGWYSNRTDRIIGSIKYTPQDVACFEKETMVEPHNGFEISYDEIRLQQRAGTFFILDSLPASFLPQLSRAIDNSIVLDGDGRDAIAFALKCKR